MKDDSKTDGQNKPSISRRGFLTGMGCAVGGLAASSIGLTGCSSATDSSATASSSSTGSTLTVVSNPNPQKDTASFTEQTMELTELFSPINIGNVKLENRMIKSGAGSGGLLAKTDTEVRPEALSYYGSIAKGGVGLVIFEASYMEPDAFLGSALNFYDDSQIPIHKTITDLVHSYDQHVFMQLYHFGGLNWMPSTCVSSSSKNYPCELDMNTNVPTMLTTEGVQHKVQQFIDQAVRAQKAGFDGVEINAGCGHLLGSFLSRFWNDERTDQYGPQSLENRARIVVEIIQGIKEACGSDYPVGVLYNGVEVNVFQLGWNSGCINFDESIEFAKIFEDAGADYLQIRPGTIGNHMLLMMSDKFYIGEPGHTGYGTVMDFSKNAFPEYISEYGGAGGFINIAAKIKQAVSIPVGTVGNMDPSWAPDIIESALEEGKIDLVFMTRPLIADPDMPNKLKEGRRDEITPCSHCISCFAGASKFACRVNARVNRAGTDEMPEGNDITTTTTPKNVMIVGGGPAGMEAARIAAQRGHHVSLYDKNGSLGSNLVFADTVKSSHERIIDLKDYLENQVDLAGVDVHLNTEITEEDVRNENPDVFICATGATYKTAPYSGGDGVPSIKDYFASSEADYKSVILLGGQIQGVEFAEYLIKKGCKVTIVEPLDVFNSVKAASTSTEELTTTIARYMPTQISNTMLPWIKAKACDIYEFVTVKEVSKTSISLETQYGTTIDLEADAVINTLQEVADTTLFDACSSIVSESYAIGDQTEPSTIMHAIAEGNVLARKI